MTITYFTIILRYPPPLVGGGLPSGASGDGSMHFEVNELLGYYGTGSV